MSSSPLIESLSAAVAANPDDLPLRLHLAQLLLAADRGGEAVGHAARVLSQDPANAAAREVMTAALGAPVPAASEDTATAPIPREPAVAESLATEPVGAEFDWQALEEQFADVVPPSLEIVAPRPAAPTLADVGGLAEVKTRLELAFLGPLRKPELLAGYGKTLRGGLLLYGPPGCGKTFLGRALATELGARFVTLSIVDVLDMWVGNSERNLHGIFESARANAPTVLFLDEVDALGHRRGQAGAQSLRTLANQLLAELDGVDGRNDNVFVLAATNAPWDVDPALRRPGRLDRLALVLPPDKVARADILRYHLRRRPLAGEVNLDRIARATEHFSGADLAHLCDSAAELALADAHATGRARPIDRGDFDAALREVRPSTGPWFAAAANVTRYANADGTYDELAAYLKRRRLG
jgi:SpoVK/Ycf46/Vps4 family AAA+-type ATPase